MTTNPEFDVLVTTFYERNSLNVDYCDKYMKGFRNRLGKFISQKELELRPDVKHIVVDCIKNHYQYYSQQKIEEIFSSFHSAFIKYLASKGFSVEKNVHFLSILNKETYKANSSLDMISLYNKVNNIANYKYKQMSSVIDNEVGYERYLNNKSDDYNNESDDYNNESDGYKFHDDKYYNNTKARLQDQWKGIFKNTEYIVLIDDYSGTGSTIDDFLTLTKDYIPDDIFILVFCIHMTEIAEERILDSFSRNSKNGAVRYFEKSKKYFHNNETSENLIEHFESEVVGPARKINILGFKKTESVVTTYRNTPNNTLSLFWSDRPEDKTWRSLFPRDEKDGKIHNKFSRWVKEKHKVNWYLDYKKIEDDEKDKVIVLIYISSQVNNSAELIELELSKLICYTDDAIQVCLEEGLIEQTANCFYISDQGTTFLNSVGLNKISWDDINDTFHIVGEKYRDKKQKNQDISFTF
ncbi:phosphoribosyltransferase-like protein [Streptococcus timonensis]